MNTLRNKTALVTGGGRGMGAAIANRLAREGADVAITYNSSRDKAGGVVSEIEKLGRKGLALSADSSDAVAVAAAVDRTIHCFERLDILVNNAGIFISKPIESLTLEDYEQTMAVNLHGVFVASQAAAAHMKAGSRIITIGSNLAEHVPMPGASLYSMSKAALTGFTKGLARDLGPRDITVNIVHPGSTNTDMNPSDGEFSDAQRGLMAIPRYGEPDDIASLVAWLASGESRFMTGAALTIDGGTNA